MADFPLVEKLFPPYWLRMIGLAEDPASLEKALSKIGALVKPFGGSVSTRCFLEPQWMMVQIAFCRNDPHENYRILMHFDGTGEPKYQTPVELVHGSFADDYKKVDRILRTTVVKHWTWPGKDPKKKIKW